MIFIKEEKVFVKQVKDCRLTHYSFSTKSTYQPYSQEQQLLLLPHSRLILLHVTKLKRIAYMGKGPII